MKKIRPITILISIISFLVVFSLVFLLIHLNTHTKVFLTLFIVFFTTLYHFLMRVLVGETVTLIYTKREFNNDSFWFKEHKWERKTYERLKVKKWKKFMLTAKPEQFDIKQTDFKTILHNINQAEIVHEIIIVLSFVPVVFSHWWDYLFIFLLTSIIAALIDLIFVIMQRYNRPRIKKIIEMRERL